MSEQLQATQLYWQHTAPGLTLESPTLQIPRGFVASVPGKQVGTTPVELLLPNYRASSLKLWLQLDDEV